MRISILLMAFVMIACNPKEEGETTPAAIAEVDNTAVIVQSLQGTYRGCIPSALYPGYWNKYEVIITNTTYDYYFELSGNASCTSPYYRMTLRYEIDKAAYVTDGDTENINIDLKMQFHKQNYKIAWYVNQNYCGLNNWVINTDNDVTGVPCVGLIAQYDSHHSSFKALNEIEYHKIQLKPASLVFPVGYVESGDSASDRKESVTAEIPKI